MQGRLVDPVRYAIVEFGALEAILHGGMVVVAVDPDRVVVHPVVIDNDALLPSRRAQRPRKVERLVLVQVDIPFEEEDNCVGRVDVEGAGELRAVIRVGVKENFMAQLPGSRGVVEDRLSAPGVLQLPVHKHEPHRP